MSSKMQRPVRSTRKRKRVDVDPDGDHESKRRKKLEKYSEWSSDGFCTHCTNPYILMTCRGCCRSWHFECLFKYIRLRYTGTQQSPLKEISVNTVAIKEEQKELEPLHNLSSLDLAAPHFPKSQRVESDGIDAEAEPPKPALGQNREPITVPAMPSKSGTESIPLYLQRIAEWIQEIKPSMLRQQRIWERRPAIQRRKEIIGVFECSDCLNKTHRCALCKLETKTDAEGVAEGVSRCGNRNCTKYYHRSCLESDASYKLHTTFSAKSASFVCPAHHCWECFERGTKQSVYKSTARRQCWHCPRSYHRQCVPLTAELLSVQRRDSDHVISKYPPFRYVISCSSEDHRKAPEDRIWPNHPKGQDLQFGRDDEKHGIFKWTMWDGTVAEFLSLEDDPFSLPLKMVKEYQRRVEKREEKRPKWLKGFKKISRSKYSKNYKKPAPAPDLGRCGCAEGCASDMSCQNYSMEIACDSTNCGSRDPAECRNREWSTSKWTDNVEVKHTGSTGYGAFAKRKLTAHRLIIEYVGEVITKEESNQRIQKLNDEKAPNFYFFQVDGRTVIDGTECGNESRFLNHSCEPNCYTTMWIVRKEKRLGIFAKTDIDAGEQLTYDYQYEVPNPDDIQNLAKCMCGARNCRFFLGFNKKKAAEWKETLRAKGQYTSDGDEEGTAGEHRDAITEKRRRKKKKKKREREGNEDRERGRRSKRKKRKSRRQRKSKSAGAHRGDSEVDSGTKQSDIEMDDRRQSRPSRAPDGRKYPHICKRCGEGFLSREQYGTHKRLHRETQRKASPNLKTN